MNKLSKLEDLAKQLNSELLSNETIKEFQKYEKLIKDNVYISNLETTMKSLQKEIVNKKAKQDDSVTDTIEEYEQIKNEFENNPIVVNYLYLKEEVDIILQNLNNSINNQL